jgi:hypothetical protein
MRFFLCCVTIPALRINAFRDAVVNFKPVKPSQLLQAIVFGLSLCAGQSHAWVLNVTPGPRAVYLAVGNATQNAANTTVNLLSVNVPANTVGTGQAQAMQSNSTQANSPFDNYSVCVPASGQVYIGGFFRLPAASVMTAVLQVTTPFGLTSGANTIPFNQISWTSTALGNAAADIPAGTFPSGGTLVLRNFAANSYVENCHTYQYANTVLAPAGQYNGVATYTLTAP